MAGFDKSYLLDLKLNGGALYIHTDLYKYDMYVHNV